jgi:ABC-type Fe3+-siderophore transport system permease subunit
MGRFASPHGIQMQLTSIAMMVAVAVVVAAAVSLSDTPCECAIYGYTVL